MSTPRGGDPLDVATDAYYYKPMASFFESFGLRAYLSAGIRFETPVLDVGCGDGTFGAMLRRCAGFEGSFTGIDYDRRAVAKGRRRGSPAYSATLAGDAIRLPFREGSFRTVFCNTTLQGVRAGPDDALREIARVLESGGRLWCTVPTRAHASRYWLARVLNRVGWRSAARLYERRLDRRLGHLHVFDPAGWAAAFERAGLEVERAVGFLPLRLVTPWSVLASTPLRVNGLFSLIPASAVRSTVAGIHRVAFRRTFLETPPHSPPDQCGYVLICARRPPP